MNRAYRVALVCGLLPILVGVSIFLLWLVMRWEWLIAAGIFTLYGGVALFFIGSVALACFCWFAFRSSDVSRKRLLFSTLGCAALLLSNFPIAARIVVAVVDIETRYAIVVHNTSDLPLEQVRVFGGGCDCFLGSIPPGDTATCFCRFHCDGRLEFCAVSGTTTHSQIIDGYVTGNMGGRAVVTIHPNGTISVIHDGDK